MESLSEKWLSLVILAVALSISIAVFGRIEGILTFWSIVLITGYSNKIMNL